MSGYKRFQNRNVPKRGETAHFGTILIHFVRAGRWRPSRPFWNVSNCLRNRHYAEVSRAAPGRDIAVSSPTHMPSTMKLGALTFKSPSVYVLFKGKQPRARAPSPGPFRDVSFVRCLK